MNGGREPLLHPNPDLVDSKNIGRVVGIGVHRGIGGEGISATESLSAIEAILVRFWPILQKEISNISL